MKNILKICLISFSLLLLVGCGNKKTLKCSLSDDSEVIKSTNTINTTFKDDEIVKIVLGSETTFSSDYKSLIDDMIETFDNEYKELSSEKGITYNTTKKDDTVKMTLSIDLDKVNDEIKEEYRYIGSSETYDGVKKELEEQGYTCK